MLWAKLLAPRIFSGRSCFRLYLQLSLIIYLYIGIGHPLIASLGLVIWGLNPWIILKLKGKPPLNLQNTNPN